MGIASAVHGAVGRASLSWAPSPRASSRTAHPDHVGYHPWPERGAAVRNATPHADADATAIEILGLVMARFTFYKSNDRLIERPHPADYDLDQLRMMECGSHLERRRGGLCIRRTCCGIRLAVAMQGGLTGSAWGSSAAE
jgi:hypothetical protein